MELQIYFITKKMYVFCVVWKLPHWCESSPIRRYVDIEIFIVQDLNQVRQKHVYDLSTPSENICSCAFKILSSIKMK